MTSYSIEPEGFEGAYDNGGRTFDRYTIQLRDIEEGTVYTVATSPNPFDGGMWSASDNISLYDRGEEIHEDIGEEIEWTQLPANVQKAVYLYTVIANNFHR